MGEYIHKCEVMIEEIQHGIKQITPDDTMKMRRAFEALSVAAQILNVWNKWYDRIMGEKNK